MRNYLKTLAISTLAATAAFVPVANAEVPESKDPIILVSHDWTGQYITTHIMGRVLKEMDPVSAHG